MIGLNRYHDAESAARPEVELVRTSVAKKKLQVRRLKEFKKRHTAQAGRALDSLGKVVDTGGKVLAELIKTVEVC